MNDLELSTNDSRFFRPISNVALQDVLKGLNNTMVLPMSFKVIKGTFDVSGLSVGSTTSIEDEEGNPISFVTGNQLLMLSGVFTSDFVTDVAGQGLLQIGLKGTEGAVGQALDVPLDLKYSASSLNVLFASVYDNGQTGTNTYNFAYSPTLDVLVTPAQVRYSTDFGETWTPTARVAEYYYGAVWSDSLGLFVLTSDGAGGIPRVVTSSDGITFNAPVFAYTDSYYGITMTSTQLIMLSSNSNGNMVTSPDGIVWTETTPVSLPLLVWQDIYYSTTQDLIVAVAYVASASNIVWSNDDGVTWNVASVNPVSGAVLNHVTFIDALGIWVLTGDFGIIATSPDGDVWTAPSSVPNITDSPEGIAYLNGLLFVNTYEGTFWVSSDSGDNWTEQTTIPASPIGVNTFGMGVLPNDTLIVEYNAGTTAILQYGQTQSLIEGTNTEAGDGFSIGSGTDLIGANKYLCVEVGTLSTSTEATSGAGQVVVMIV